MNEKLFGVQTTYQEELYTTALDRSSDFYKQRERAAARIADEIERGLTANVHMAEERGHVAGTDENELDEEDRYGAVVRSVPPSVARAPAALSGSPPTVCCISSAA